MYLRHHRHLVAVPVLLVLMLSLAGVQKLSGRASALLPSAASSLAKGLQSQGDPVPFALAGSTRGVLDPESTLSFLEGRAELMRGSMLLETDRYARIGVAGADVHLFAGTFSAFRDAERATVVSLTAPILVSFPGASFLVTNGYQLQWQDGSATEASLTKVPDQWMQETQKRRYEAGEDLSVDVPEMRAEGVGHPFATRDRANALSEGVHFPLRSAQDVGSALKRARNAEPSLRLDHLLALQLTMADPPVTDAAASLIGAVLMDTDDAEHMAFAILALGAALDRPIPHACIAVWTELMHRSLSRMPDGVLTRALPLLARLPSLLEERGFPLSARTWQEARMRVVRFALPLLSLSARSVLDTEIVASLQASLIDQLDEPNMSSSSIASVSTVRTSDAYARSRLPFIRELFLRNGAMLSDQSILAVDRDNPTLIRVSGVYFASADGDQAFDLTIDPDSLVLEQIIRGTERLPNAVPFAQFLASLEKKP